MLLIVELYWPGVSEHCRLNHGPLVMSSSHTSTVSEELSTVLAVMMSLSHIRHIVTQFIVRQLDCVSHLISHSSSSASVPAVSVQYTLLFVTLEFISN